MTSIGGNVVVDGTVTARQASQPGQAVVLGEDGKVPESMVPAYTLPIGGDAIGGVKNGGNVTINADGTMDAEASGGVTKTIIESYNDLITALNSNGNIGCFKAIHSSTPSITIICFFGVASNDTNDITVGYLLQTNSIKGYITRIDNDGHVYYITSGGLEGAVELSQSDTISGYFI